MTDFNEFNWNEEPGGQPSATQRPLYHENVLKAKKRTKTKTVLGVICGAVAGSLITGCLVMGVGFHVFGNAASTTMFVAGQRENTDAQQLTTVTVDSKTPLTIPTIAKTVGPAVVGVSCSVTYNSFFGTQSGVSSGSGIVITEDGYVVTNYHVVNGATGIKVKFNDGNETTAQFVGGEESSDVAVLKLDTVPADMKVAVLGDSDAVEVGDLAVAIGNPLADELFGTVTSGIISGLNRQITVQNRQMTLLQTDAAINSGNSGGALINEYGEVIGINSVKLGSGSMSGSSTVEGLCFAIPINEVKPIVSDVIQYGYVKGRPLVGVTVREVTKDLAYYNDLPVDHGLYVMGVSEGGGAEVAGIRRGDIILKVDGKDVTTSAELNAVRDAHQAGDTVDVVLDRDGAEITLQLTFTENQSAT